ncbi:ParB/RepB/Spo0J family partition protein [Candidatus Woesebacteria bacterium]|nr:ParB/RepB/Spo0J family partition protein [Candidatus Woesebacteria bacterium]
MQNQTVQNLDIKILEANPFQPREKINNDELEDLVKSIRIHGILEPLVVAHTPAGYQIIAGERRWRAAKIAGLTEVPTIIKETTPKGMLEMAIIENLQRVNLTPIERAQAFFKLQQEFNLGVGEVADRVGKSVSFISNSIKLLELPDAIKDGLLGKQISEGHARAISGIQDVKTMIEVYKQILKENASVRRAEELARIAKTRTGQTRIFRPKTVVYQVDDEQVKNWEEKVKSYLGARSKLKLKRTTQSTQVSFILKGDPEETQDGLEKIMDFVNSIKKES